MSFSVHMMTPRVATGLILLLTGGWLAGCASPPPPALQREEPREIAWSPERVRQHIQALDGVEMEGRQTASRGFTRAAAYVSGRLRNMGLQPVLQREYRMQYASRVRRANRLDFRVIERDTIRWLPGKDFLVTGIPENWQVQGQGALSPAPGFLVWKDGMGEGWTDQVSHRFQVQVQEDVTTAPMHVMGILPGADPLQRDSVVVLVAPLDGFGLQREQSWTDGRDLSIPAAALLETTRRLATLQRQWAFLPHSVLVVFASGTLDACQGVESLVRNLPWDAEAVLGIHVFRMEADTRCDWEGSWAATAPTTLWTAYSPFPPEGGYGFGPWRPRTDAVRTDPLDASVQEALRLAQGVMADVR